tara:strand:- start:146 stop:316 length:171 start_codon:yes stop_codon:yes gene_type:complete
MILHYFLVGDSRLLRNHVSNFRILQFLLVLLRLRNHLFDRYKYRFLGYHFLRELLD